MEPLVFSSSAQVTHLTENLGKVHAVSALYVSSLHNSHRHCGNGWVVHQSTGSLILVAWKLLEKLHRSQPECLRSHGGVAGHCYRCQGRSLRELLSGTWVGEWGALGLCVLETLSPLLEGSGSCNFSRRSSRSRSGHCWSSRFSYHHGNIGVAK